MGADFQKLCAAHDLSCISIMFYPGRVTLFLHWDDQDRGDQCVSASGATFDEAFEEALIDVAVTRVEAA